MGPDGAGRQHVHRSPMVAVVLPRCCDRRDGGGVLADRRRPCGSGAGRVGPMTAVRSDIALEIRGLVVTGRANGRAVPILNGVDLDLQSGEILGLAGEAGSAKSTLCPAPASV